MIPFKSFPGIVIKPDWVEKVTTGSYDSYSPEERAVISSNNPYSFLNVTKSLEDLPSDQRDNIDGLLDGCLKAMDSLYEAEVYQDFNTPSLFIYRIEIPYESITHSQTGIVGLIPVESNDNFSILRHEKVRPERSLLMSKHLLALRSSSSPISLTYRNDRHLNSVMNSFTKDKPILTTENNELKQKVWKISGDQVDHFLELLGQRDLYITDGHHRMAAAEEALRQSDAASEAFRWTQAVLFPDNELLVLPFHRRVGDLKNRNAQELVECSEKNFAIPKQPGQVGVYLDKKWYLMNLPEAASEKAVDRIDVSRLQAGVLEPVFEVRDPSTHTSIDYVPAPLGLDALSKRCDFDRWTGFILHPLNISDLMDIADSGELMPPKSSYLIPKPRSGVFVRNLEKEGIKDY